MINCQAISQDHHNTIVEYRSAMEMTMAYIPNSPEFLPSVHGRGAATSNSPRGEPGILRRIVHAMFESRQRQADREIARFLARSGGRLTDDVERRLTGHLLSHNWTVRD